ncbi:aldehyde dehydrogenase family protein [Egicoccus sp. AB-alg2]|uniref:aldehyde dehydrogenase family protein n=1 Tax=Egicoccus sp. AB-alg2 TaxID=3242693 RepID=UPI00359DF1E5
MAVDVAHDVTFQRQQIASRTYGFRIGGSRIQQERSTLPAVDPTTERTITDVPLATMDDVDDAVAAANEAGRAWGRLHWTERARALRAFADVIEEHAEELGRLDTVDAGLPISTAVKDAHDAAKACRYFAGLAGEVVGRAFPWSPGAPFMHTNREPYGVVGKIVPFNHPVKFAAVKSAPALVTGNSVIVKPSEFTMLSALRLAELADEVLPPGVFTVLPGGADVGAALVEHPDVPRLAFTGSVATGQHVMRGAATEIKHVTAELGGKNPLLVFPDVDIPQVARAAVNSLDLFRSPGQACWSTSRVFVHEAIHDRFLDEVLRVVATIQVGDPLDQAMDIGPVAYEGHRDRVDELIRSGIEEGARPLAGGIPDRERTGFFVDPTVFADVEPGMRIAQEEVFGPVMSVLRWSDESSLLAAANDVPYGLTAAIWSADVGRAQVIARELQAGIVWINTASARPVGMPFGGYKRSGVGKEGNLEDLFSYTQEKAVIVGTDARSSEDLDPVC